MSRVRLGDVAKEHKETCKGDKSDYPIVGLEHLEPECITLSQWSESTDNTFSKVFRKGHVLFGRRRAYLKKAAVAPFDGICSGDITVIEAIPGRIIPELLPFVIQNDALFDFAVGRSAGSLSPRVKWEHLKNYEFELPTSEEEQRKLADVLWSIEQTRKSYNSLLRATDELVKSQFIELFGDPVKNPSDFPKRTIGECCILKSGTTLPEELENEGGEIPYIKVADMNIEGNEGYITTSTRFVSEKSAGSGIFPYGAVIFPKRGGAILTNKKRMVLRPICADLNIMGVISKGELNPFYLKVFFDSLDLASILNGSTIPQINNKDIAPLCILVPPIAQQSRFADFVQQLDKSKYAGCWIENRAAA